MCVGKLIKIFFYNSFIDYASLSRPLIHLTTLSTTTVLSTTVTDTPITSPTIPTTTNEATNLSNFNFRLLLINKTI